MGKCRWEFAQWALWVYFDRRETTAWWHVGKHSTPPRSIESDHYSHRTAGTLCPSVRVQLSQPPNDQLCLIMLGGFAYSPGPTRWQGNVRWKTGICCTWMYQKKQQHFCLWQSEPPVNARDTWLVTSDALPGWSKEGRLSKSNIFSLCLFSTSFCLHFLTDVIYIVQWRIFSDINCPTAISITRFFMTLYVWDVFLWHIQRTITLFDRKKKKIIEGLQIPESYLTGRNWLLYNMLSAKDDHIFAEMCWF